MGVIWRARSQHSNPLKLTRQVLIPRPSGRHPCGLVGATIAMLMLSAGLAGTFSEHRNTQVELRERLAATTQELEHARHKLAHAELELELIRLAAAEKALAEATTEAERLAAEENVAVQKEALAKLRAQLRSFRDRGKTSYSGGILEECSSHPRGY